MFLVMHILGLPDRTSAGSVILALKAVQVLPHLVEHVVLNRIFI